MFLHLLGGIRHFIWAVGAGLEKHTASKLGWATLFPPKTKGWSRARAAIEEYVEEVEAANRKALGLGAKGVE